MGKEFLLKGWYAPLFILFAAFAINVADSSDSESTESYTAEERLSRHSTVNLVERMTRRQPPPAQPDTTTYPAPSGADEVVCPEEGCAKLDTQQSWLIASVGLFLPQIPIDPSMVPMMAVEDGVLVARSASVEAEIAAPAVGVDAPAVENVGVDAAPVSDAPSVAAVDVPSTPPVVDFAPGAMWDLEESEDPVEQLAPTVAAGDVIISGFQPSVEPEWVELFNTTDQAVALDNLELIARVDMNAGDGTVTIEWQLPAGLLTGANIQPHSFFLIGESGVANADLTTTLNFGTGEGGVTERAIGLELLIDSQHMDYLLYGRHDGVTPCDPLTTQPCDVPPGDIVFGGFAQSTNATATVGGGSESAFNTVTPAPDPSLLVDGENVIAVLVNQRDSTSSDMGFNLTLDSNLGPHILDTATWSYLDDGTEQPPEWIEPGFVETWATGQAKLGYNDGAVTTLSCGCSTPCNLTCTPKTLAYYFRHEFTVADASLVTSLTMAVLRDDAAIVYLNGTEVWRSNMPAGPIGMRTETIRTLSGALDAFREGVTQRVSAEDLYAGYNVEGFYADEDSGPLPGNFPPGDWTSAHATTGGNAPRHSGTAPVDQPNSCVLDSDCDHLDTDCVEADCIADECIETNINEGLTCEDGDLCTSGELCAAGACGGGSTTLCPGQVCNPADGFCVDCLVQGDCELGETCNPTTLVCELAPVSFQQGVGYTGTVDTFLDDVGGSTDDNSADAVLIVDGDDVRQILLRFEDLFVSQGGPIPDGAAITNATLTVNVTNASATGANLHRMLQTWNDTDTWDSWVDGIDADDVDAVSAADTSGTLNSTGSYDLNVTASLQAWSDGATNYGWVFLAAGTDSWQFNSSDPAVAVGNRPLLTVEYLVGSAPDAPASPSPADTVDGVSLEPSLQVTVSDPDAGDLLDVRFYGRLKDGVAPPEPFTLIHLTDTQHYSQSYPGTFYAITNWIWAEKDSRNIVFTTLSGDIVNVAGDTGQWSVADVAFQTLESGSGAGYVGVDYGLSPGNHDVGDGLVNYNSYFGIDRYFGRPYYQGWYDDAVNPGVHDPGENNNNHYEFFSAGGMDFIVIHLEWGVAGSPAVLSWVDNLLQTHSDRRAIIVSHYLMDDDSGALAGDGPTVFSSLMDRPNLFLMLAGHKHVTDGENDRSDLGSGGNTVYTMVADYQDLPGGGNGNVRILEFVPAADEIRVFTYSVLDAAFVTDADSQFVLPYDMDGSAPFVQIGATQTGVANGGTASVTWSGLSALEDYEWYATVSDGSRTTTGPTWSFTTICTNGQCDDGNFCNGTETCDAGGTNTCIPGIPIDCTPDLCDPSDGSCVECLVDADCGDTNVCDGQDVCIAGSCTTVPAPDCDDLVACTDDSCDPVAGCMNVDNCVGAGEFCDALSGSCLTAYPLPIVVGDTWKYFKGTAEPAPYDPVTPAWALVGFDDSSWSDGGTGIGYDFYAETTGTNGNGDYEPFIATQIDDMSECTTRPPCVLAGEGYLSVYMRREFHVADPSLVTSMTFSMYSDDGYVAYLNGVEISRARLGTVGTPPAFNVAATGGPVGSPPVETGGVIDVSINIADLVAGTNVLAIQAHNVNLTSRDLLAIPQLSTVETPPCTGDLDCDDANDCTDDTCDLGTGSCEYANNDANSCDDSVACTNDSCSSGACVSVDACTGGEVCNLGTGICETPVPADPLPIAIGDEFLYFKGTGEPSPGGGGEATTDWTQILFDDSGWLAGDSGFAYGTGAHEASDPDTNTVLGDMQNGYVSVYFRREFHIDSPAAVDTMTLTVDYDDAFVAYVNGVEVARSSFLSGLGDPPAYDQVASSGHEGNTTEQFDVAAAIPGLVSGTNVLAIQLHNATLNSSDAVLRPLLDATFVSLCTFDADCDDSNPCTDDVCDPGGPGAGPDGCVITNNDANSCDDGLFCSEVDSCIAGVCTGGAPPDCAATGQFCSEDLDACVDCLSDLDCGAGEICNVGTGLCEVYSGPLAGDVIISGFQASTNATEWFELFNTTNQPISLADMNIVTRFDLPLAAPDGSLDVDWDMIVDNPGLDLTGLTIAPYSFFQVQEGAGGDLSVPTVDLSTGEMGIGELMLSIELTVGGVHMDYVLYGNNGQTAAPPIAPGDVAWNGTSFPRDEVIRSVTVTTAFNEGATWRATAADLHAGYDALGFYSDDPELGVWSSDHSPTQTTGPRNSSTAAVPPPVDTCSVPGDCDDGNPCTDDTCPAGICVYTSNDANSCDDGEACTDDACVSGVCVGTANDGNSCTDDVACTDDTCTTGVCVSVDNCTGGLTCDFGSGICVGAPTILTFQEGVASYAGTVDTFIQESLPGATHGGDPSWGWDDDEDNAGAGTDRALGLIRFDNIFGGGAGQVPIGATITSATLTLTVFDVGGDGDLRELLVDWNSNDGLTDICDASCDEGTEYGATLSTTVPSATTGAKVVDVTGSLQAWSTNPANNRGWIVLPLPSGGVDVRSAEYGTVAERPLLTVSFAPCTIDSECNDGNFCTSDVCNAGSCEYTNTNEGLGCDDGISCTGTDICTAGNCAGSDTCPAGQFCDLGADACVDLPNTPPDAPTNELPADTSTGIDANPQLCVDVTDPDADTMDVSFYGREFTTGPTEDFSIVVLPDTQMYSANGGDPSIFEQQTQWIADNQAALNIVFTAHVGDIVNTPSSVAEWIEADEAMSLLDPAGNEELVPYSMGVGNHDQDPRGSAGTRADEDSTTALFNQYFGVDRFCPGGACRSYYGDHYGVSNDNSYQLFSAGGMDFIVLNIEYDQTNTAMSPGPDDGSLAWDVMTWAEGVLATYSNRRAIINSHYIISASAVRSTQGNRLRNWFQDNDNVFMMVSGHLWQANRLADPTVSGDVSPADGQCDDPGQNCTFTLLADYQNLTAGGNGWLRVMTFSPDNDTIRVRTYSPTLGAYIEDCTNLETVDCSCDVVGNTWVCGPSCACTSHGNHAAGTTGNDFYLTYNMQGGPSFEQIGTTQLAVVSGGQACVDWPAREDGKTYEWYVEVSDGTDTTIGPPWTFTSDGACTSDADCDDGLYCNGAETCDIGGTNTCVAGSNPCSGGTPICDEDNDVCVACSVDADCDDSDACTTDSCTAGACFNTPQDCSDGNACTDDVCTDGVCSNPYNPTAGCCVDAADCDDGDVCSIDLCNAGTCSNTADPACCDQDADCDDGNVCTADTCNTANAAALSFDGSNDHVTMGSAAGLNAASFTLEAWVKWDGGGTTGNTGSGGINAIPLITKGRGEADADPRDMNYFFGVLPGGQLVADFEEHTSGGSPGLNHPATAASILPTGTWHHVAVTYDGSCWEIYLDGVDDLPGANCPNEPPNFVSTQHFGLGTAMNSGGTPEGRYSGLMDEVRVWNVARSQAEIAADMAAELTSGTGLLARYGLNEGTGGTAGDSVDPAEDGTLSGATWELVDLPTLGSGTCSFTPIPDCCLGDGDCADDGNACTLEQCLLNACESVYSPTPGCCTGPADCDDGDACTTDTCDGNSDCVHTADPGCCDDDADCDDGSLCTLDICSLGTTAGVVLDGTNDYVTMGLATSLGVASFTLEGWFQWDGGGVTGSSGGGGIDAYPLISKGRGESETATLNANYFFGIVPGSGNLLGADFEEHSSGSSVGLNHPVLGSTAVTTGVWHHAAVTYDGCWQLYLDGVPETAGTDCPNEPPDFDSIQHFAIGTGLSSSGAPQGYFPGKIDEVRVWNRALSDSEILDGMDATIDTAAPPGLIGRWSLDDGAGGLALDSAGSNDGTLTNGPTWELVDLPVLTTAQCEYIAIPGCCEVDADCDDGDACTTEVCNAGACEYTAVPDCCLDDTDCDDGNGCTNDVCDNNVCTYPVIPDCCLDDNDCDDGDACTADTCELSNTAALSFDGTNDYVDLGNAASITDFGTGSFTVEGWFYADTTPGTWDGLFRVGRQGPNSQVAVQFNGGLTVSVEDTAAHQIDTPAMAVSTGQWHHYAAVIDRTANQLRLYLDGGTAAGGNESFADGTAWAANPINHTDNAMIGAARNSTGTLIGYFDGLIDETRVWNYARTQVEIAADMNSQIDSGPGLVHHWGMSEGSGTTTADSAGTDDGTLVGATWELVNLVDFGSNQCAFTPIPDCCETPADCNDGDICTLDDCVGNVCQNDAIANCCVDDADCNDGDACTTDTCDAFNQCQNTVDAGVCDDNEQCTIDSCLPGVNLGAISLDGTGDYVSFGTEDTHDELDLTRFTVETWFKKTGPGDTTAISTQVANIAIPLVTKGRGVGDGSNVDLNYFLGVHTTGGNDYLTVTFESYEAPGGDNDNQILGATPITAGTWHHAAATYDGTNLRLYLDGAEDGVFPTTNTPRDDSVHAFAIGTAMGVTTPDGYFEGDIDEVRVWDHARTPIEIVDGMQRQIPAAPGLVGSWKLDDGSGTTATDSSASSNDGTLNGDALWISSMLVDVAGCDNTPVVNGTICDDSDLCTELDSCTDGVCGGTDVDCGSQICDPGDGSCVDCLVDADCDDGNSCTVDACTANVCSNTFIPDCCSVDADCDDADACTLDFCPMGTNTAALSFDGTNDRVAMGQATTELGTATFTLELWFNWGGGGDTASSGTGGIVGVPLVAKGRGEADGDNRDANYVFALTGGKLAADFESVDPSPNNFPVFGNTTVTTGVWHHAAVTYDGTCWQIYLDGDADTNGLTCPGTTPRFDSIQHFGIGTTLNSTGVADGAFDGLIDEVRVWNRALSEPEIQANMGREILTDPDLLGRWGLNEGSGSTAGDTTTPAVDGSIVGATWVTAGLLDFGTANVCEYVPIPDCCIDNTDCDDGNACTLDECTGNECVFTPIPGCCNDSGDCDDGDVCTDDVCDANVCTYPDIANCCLEDNDCDDSNACTADTCAVSNPSAVSVDGANDYVDFGNAATIADFGTGSFTIEGWFYADTAPVTYAGIFRAGRQQAHSQVAVQYNGGLTASVEDTAAHQIDTPAMAINVGQWHHYAMVVDRSTNELRLYLDGGIAAGGNESFADASGWGTNSIAHTDNVMVGAARNGSGAPFAFFDGELDDLRIWNYARTQPEIEVDMFAKIDSAPGLIHFWGFDEGTGSTAFDSVGTDHGTFTGDTAWETTGLLEFGGGDCEFDPVADGTTCDDSDACTQTDQCQSGTCAGANPVVCTASDQCHDVGVCDSGTGTCSDPVLPDGTSCDDLDPLTLNDQCTGGVCAGFECLVDGDCDDSNPCTQDSCDTGTGECSNDSAPLDGSTCGDPTNTTCDAADSCSAGVCEQNLASSGTSCGDPTDTDCSNPDTCDGAGTCQSNDEPNGTTCDDGDVCNVGETCTLGVCGGGGAVDCSGTGDACNANDSCDPAGLEGNCDSDGGFINEGGSCDDGDSCLINDTCSSGVCAGTPPALDDTLCNGEDDDCDGDIDEDYVDTATACGIGACESTGTMTCVGGSETDSCVAGSPAPNDVTCDNVDDNCNGTADEGYVPDDTCFLPGACATGNEASSCSDGIETACQPGSPSGESEALCNGVDDDCDSDVDEDYVSDTSCFLPGDCSAGDVASSCVAGSQTACTTGTPTTELCDGDDNDCDGLTDEDPAGDPLTQATTCGQGVCSTNTGFETCIGGVYTNDTCDPNAGATAEVCDTFDNDCDGLTDEAPSGDPLTQATTCGVGACLGNTGVETCVGGVYANDTCDPNDGASAEVCDNVDNDCDGPVDEADGGGPLTQITTCGVGQCAGNEGVETCTGGSYTGDTCDPLFGATPDNQCDGVDNDCDGPADDDYVPTPTACGVGECLSAGLLTCVAGLPVDTCIEGTPEPEVCDGLDNNCDGDIDENGAVLCDDGSGCTMDVCNGASGCDYMDTCPGDQFCDVAGDICATTVRLPTVDVCTGGDLYVPVVVDSIDGLIGLNLGFSYDPLVLAPFEVLPAAASAGYAVGSNLTVPGEVSISLFSPIPGSGGGTVAWVHFTVVGATGSSTALQWLNSALDEGSVGAVEVDGQIDVTAASTSLSLPDDVAGTPGGTVIVPVLADPADGIGVILVVEFDPTVIQYVDATTTTLSAGFGIVKTLDAPGKLVISLFGVFPLSGSGSIVDIEFLVVGNSGDSSPLLLSEGEIDEGAIPSCLDDGFLRVCGSVAADDLTCDGVDDDCNGLVDDGYVSTGSTCGLGACAGNTGTLECIDGSVVDSCDPFDGAAADDATCDGIDEDCDGTDAEDYVTTPTTCGVGACDGNSGQLECQDGSEVDTCDPLAGATADDQCDNLDNDCDGSADDDYIATPTSCGVGQCAGNVGVLACVDGTIDDTCDPLLGATEEICDGVDNDCDDVVDDGPSAGDIGDEVRFGPNPTVITWADLPNSNVYNVYKGNISSVGPFSYDHICYEPESPDARTEDTAIPAAGQVFYYLVSALNSCQGEDTLGTDSSGTARPNDNPCPNQALDSDLDGHIDINDNCPLEDNPGQEDQDIDGVGDVCDNCPTTTPGDQRDRDDDGIGNICDACTDSDADGFGDPGFPVNTCDEDNCPLNENPGQEDQDVDGLGDVCDACDNDPDNDIDLDGVCGDLDICPADYDPDQEDADIDGVGDVCDVCTDIDGDGFGDPGFPANTCDDDNCPGDDNPGQEDPDADGVGSLCDICPDDFDPSQTDLDFDTLGDACDPCPSNPDPACQPCPPGDDSDGDGICSTQEMPVDLGGAMDYRANGDDPLLGLTWTEQVFALPGDWQSGTYGVGYDVAGEHPHILNTSVPTGAFSIYTRATFDVADPGAVVRVRLGADYGDSYVAWLNGAEIYRSLEMPAGAPDWNTLALNTHEASNPPNPYYHPLVDVTALAVLQPVGNVLAVGVWNDDPGSDALILVPQLTVATSVDNCVFVSNPDQTDTDGDGLGDACDVD